MPAPTRYSRARTPLPASRLCPIRDNVSSGPFTVTNLLVGCSRSVIVRSLVLAASAAPPAGCRQKSTDIIADFTNADCGACVRPCYRGLPCFAAHGVAPHGGAVRRGKQDEKTYCLTEKCSQDVERCLTKHAPVASLASGRATAPLPFHKSMLTDVGPVELWATPLRRPSAAANPQGSSRRLDDR